MKALKYICMVALLGVIMAPHAHAQDKRASGLSAASSQEAACQSEVTKIRDQLQELGNFVGALEECNAQGKFFDGYECVSEGIQHEWRYADGKPDEIIFKYKNTQVGDPIKVYVGEEGNSVTDPVCPSGYSAGGPN